MKVLLSVSLLLLLLLLIYLFSSSSINCRVTENIWLAVFCVLNHSSLRSTVCVILGLTIIVVGKGSVQ